MSYGTSRRGFLVTLLVPGVSAAGAALAHEVPAGKESFAAWRRQFRRRALAGGIRAGVFDQALGGVRPVPEIIARDRRQAEGRLTRAEYLRRVATPDRIRRGTEVMERYAGPLGRAARVFGPPPEIICALWGVETDYGQARLPYRLFPALATLAHEGRRRRFFEQELVSALRIVQEGRLAPGELASSWAGALGQSQFMPSSYLRHAVDFDGDGTRDIWKSEADVIGSIASYLAGNGWRAGQPWNEMVSAPDSLRTGDSPSGPRRVDEWLKAGVARQPELASSGAGTPARLLFSGDDGPAVLLYHNHDVLLRWNRSHSFAVAVGVIADGIRKGL